MNVYQIKFSAKLKNIGVVFGRDGELGNHKMRRGVLPQSATYAW